MAGTGRRLWTRIFLGSGFLRVLSHHGSVMAQTTTIMDLEEARDLWFNWTQGLPTDYTFEYIELSSSSSSSSSSSNPFREDPYAIDVRSDAVARVYSTGLLMIGSSPLDPVDFPTIPDLFDMIEEAQADGTALMEPMVQYNDRYGYPTSISIVYNTTNTVDISVLALTPYTLLQDELDMQVALWESYEEASDSYWYTIQVFCFCFQEYGSPKRIVVENNTIVSTTDIATGELVEQFTYETVPELFGRIQRSIDGYDVSIQVSYDETLGYPTSISTNPEYNIADAGITIETSNVTLGVWEEFGDEFGDEGEEEEPNVVDTDPTVPPTTMNPTNVDTISPTGTPSTETPAPTERTIRPVGGRLCSGIFRVPFLCRGNN
jgi:hypothetical protein